MELWGMVSFGTRDDHATACAVRTAVAIYARTGGIRESPQIIAQFSSLWTLRHQEDVAQAH